MDEISMKQPNIMILLMIMKITNLTDQVSDETIKSGLEEQKQKHGSLPIQMHEHTGDSGATSSNDPHPYKSKTQAQTNTQSQALAKANADKTNDALAGETLNE